MRRTHGLARIASVCGFMAIVFTVAPPARALELFGCTLSPTDLSGSVACLQRAVTASTDALRTSLLATTIDVLGCPFSLRAPSTAIACLQKKLDDATSAAKTGSFDLFGCSMSLATISTGKACLQKKLDDAAKAVKSGSVTVAGCALSLGSPSAGIACIEQKVADAAKSAASTVKGVVQDVKGAAACLARAGQQSLSATSAALRDGTFFSKLGTTLSNVVQTLWSALIANGGQGLTALTGMFTGTKISDASLNALQTFLWNQLVALGQRNAVFGCLVSAVRPYQAELGGLAKSALRQLLDLIPTLYKKVEPKLLDLLAAELDKLAKAVLGTEKSARLRELAASVFDPGNPKNAKDPTLPPAPPLPASLKGKKTIAPGPNSPKPSTRLAAMEKKLAAFIETLNKPTAKPDEVRTTWLAARDLMGGYLSIPKVVEIAKAFLSQLVTEKIEQIANRVASWADKGISSVVGFFQDAADGGAGLVPEVGAAISAIIAGVVRLGYDLIGRDALRALVTTSAGYFAKKVIDAGAKYVQSKLSSGADRLASDLGPTGAALLSAMRPLADVLYRAVSQWAKPGAQSWSSFQDRVIELGDRLVERWTTGR